MQANDRGVKVSALALLVAMSAGAQAPKSITLDEALRYAREANPRVEQARANVQRAAAIVTQSRSLWLPTITANGTLTQLEGDRKLADRVLTAGTSVGGNVQLAVPILAIPRWLATGQAIDAETVATLEQNDVERQMMQLAGRAWLQVRLTQRLVEIAQRATETSAAELDLARKRGAGGIGTRLDVVRAERQWRENQSRAEQAKAELAVAREVLGALLAFDGPVDVNGDPALPELTPNTSFIDAVKTRADVIAAQERVKLAQRRVNESWLDYVPTVSIVAQPTFQAPPTPTAPAIGFQAQLFLVAPLYDGGARSGLYRERASLLRQAEAIETEVKLRATSEARTANVQLEARLAAAASAKESATLAAEARKLAELAYSEGASTNLELIEADRAARDAATQASVAENAVESARFDLLIAVGQIGVPQEGANRAR